MLTYFKTIADDNITKADVDEQIDRLNILYADHMAKRLENSDRACNYNKINKEWHNISNNIYQAKRAGNAKRLAYWQQKMAEYKANKKGVK
jgi:hypothetical protein